MPSDIVWYLGQPFYQRGPGYLMYMDNDLGLWPSSYPYILGRSLSKYKINTSVISYSVNYDFNHNQTNKKLVSQ